LGDGDRASEEVQEAIMHLELMNPEQVAAQSSITSDWLAMQTSNADLYALYRSTTWWDHLVATHNARHLRLGVFTTALGNRRQMKAEQDDQQHGSIVAAIPLESRKFGLPLHSGRRRAMTIPFRTVSAVTVDPLLRMPAANAAAMLNSLATSWPRHDGFYVKSIGVATPLWKCITECPRLADSFVYVADNVRPLYSIEFPATFDEYLRKFSGKTRNTLRRKVKMLREQGGGALTLVRTSTVEGVRTFLDGVREIGKRSWKKTGSGWAHISGTNALHQLEDVARRGFLRSYILRVGDAPCAFVNGYQHGGVYHYADLAYEERFAKWSPGLVLLYLLIEDLCADDPPRQLNFGTGYADYKRQFANQITHDASVLVLRQNMGNRLRVGLHSGILSLKEMLKRRLRRETTPRTAFDPAPTNSSDDPAIEQTTLLSPSDG
jgi:hypothetical protein